MSILALRRKQKEKIPNRRVGGSKKKGNSQSKEREKNSQSKSGRKQKKKKNSRSKIGRKQKKYTEKSLDQTTSGQIQSYHQVNKKRKETTT